jgi:hypothetical protein
VKVRKILYYALWPVEQLFYFLSWLGRWLKMLIIVSNPIFLAIYLMNRERRRGKENEEANAGRPGDR